MEEFLLQLLEPLLEPLLGPVLESICGSFFETLFEPNTNLWEERNHIPRFPRGFGAGLSRIRLSPILELEGPNETPG
jgi:hypothetical protein